MKKENGMGAILRRRLSTGPRLQGSRIQQERGEIARRAAAIVSYVGVRPAAEFLGVGQGTLERIAMGVRVRSATLLFLKHQLDQLEAELKKPPTGGRSRTRAQRGSAQVFQAGVDQATGLPRFHARFTVGGERQFVCLHATSMGGARAELARGRNRMRQGLPFHGQAPETPADQRQRRWIVKEMKGTT